MYMSVIFYQAQFWQNRMYLHQKNLITLKKTVFVQYRWFRHTFRLQNKLLYTRNFLCTQLRTLWVQIWRCWDKKYTTGTRINYIASSVHSSVTFKILTAVIDKWVQFPIIKLWNAGKGHSSWMKKAINTDWHTVSTAVY